MEKPQTDVDRRSNAARAPIAETTAADSAHPRWQGNSCYVDAAFGMYSAAVAAIENSSDVPSFDIPGATKVTRLLA